MKTLDDALSTPGVIAAGYYEFPVVPGRMIGRHARISSEAFGLVHIASAILSPSELRRIADHLDPQADNVAAIRAEARREALEEAIAAIQKNRKGIKNRRENEGAYIAEVVARKLIEKDSA